MPYSTLMSTQIRYCRGFANKKCNITGDGKIRMSNSHGAKIATVTHRSVESTSEMYVRAAETQDATETQDPTETFI